MSATATAQEQSAPPATPPQIDMAQANTINEQIATARMSGAGKDAIQELEGQLASALGAAPVQPPAVEPKEQQQQQPIAETPTPEPEPVVEKSPEEIAAEAATLEAEEEKESANHIRIKTYPDKEKDLVSMAHQMFKKGLAPSFTEALDRLRGIQPASTQPEPEPEAPVIPPEIMQFENEVATLEAKLDELGATEGLFNGEIATLTKQLSRANAQLEGARIRHESRTEVKTAVSDATFETQRADVLKDTAKDYPAMSDKSSPQWLLAKRLAKAALDESDPSHGKLFDLDAPRFFADEAAKLLGIKPASVPSTPQPPKPTPTAPKTPIAPVAPGSRGTIVQPQATSQDLIKMVEGNLASVLAGTGGTIKPSHAPPKVIMLR